MSYLPSKRGPHRAASGFPWRTGDPSAGERRRLRTPGRRRGNRSATTRQQSEPATRCVVQNALTEWYVCLADKFTKRRSFWFSRADATDRTYRVQDLLGHGKSTGRVPDRVLARREILFHQSRERGGRRPVLGRRPVPGNGMAARPRRRVRAGASRGGAGPVRSARAPRIGSCRGTVGSFVSRRSGPGASRSFALQPPPNPGGRPRRNPTFAQRTAAPACGQAGAAVDNSPAHADRCATKAAPDPTSGRPRRPVSGRSGGCR